MSIINTVNDVDLGTSFEDICLEVPEYDDYGIEAFKHAPHQLLRELQAYAIQRGRYGRDIRKRDKIDASNSSLQSPLQHMCNIIGILWPRDVVLQSRGILNTNALRILKALCESNDIGIVGNASSGKTHIIAAFALADWLSAAHCTSVYVATVTLESSEDRLWGNICRLFNLASKRFVELMGKNAKVGTLISYRKMIVYGDVNDKDETRDYQNAIKALAFPVGSEGQKAVDTTRGRKNSRVRMYIDELPEMEPYVLKVRANLLANKDFIFATAGNPSNSSNNPHKELCEPNFPQGWEAVNKDMEGWPTRTGICIFLSGLRSPNFNVSDTEDPPFPFLLTRESEQDILKTCYGNKNSLEYWRNVIGFWPGTEIEQTVLSRSFIASSETNVIPRWSDKKQSIICGFDTGFTLGGDRCMASFFRLGEDERHRQVSQFIGTKEFQADVNEVFESSIAKKVVKACIDAGVEPRNFGMDISGDGGKMLQAIMIEWMKTNPLGSEIVAISSMGNPTDRIVSSENPKPCSEVYDRRVTEYWYSVRNALSTKSLYGLDLELHRSLVTELCSRLYEHKGKKIAVETKKDMKLRLRKSPDEGDCFVYGLEMCRRAGLEFITPDEEDISDQIRVIGRRFEGIKDEEDEEEFAYASADDDPDWM